MSLSRCAGGSSSTELQFAISDPTPGLQNSCPQDTFAVDLPLCFLTPRTKRYGSVLTPQAKVQGCFQPLQRPCLDQLGAVKTWVK